MAFIKEIANYINNNCDLSKPLTIIFPNKRAALKLRMELMNGDYKKNIWLPQMLSIQEAMCSWSGLQLLDNIDIIFELIKIIGNIDSNDVYGLASQMVKDFDEIDQYAVDAQDLFQNIKDAKEIDIILEHDGVLNPIEIKKTSNPSTELTKVFSLLDKASVPRAKGAILCMKPELNVLDRENYIVPIWMI